MGVRQMAWFRNVTVVLKFLPLIVVGVVGWDRNVTTNRMLANNGIEVISVSGSELGRGRGGTRCMICPIQRDPN